MSSNALSRAAFDAPTDRPRLIVVGAGSGYGDLRQWLDSRGVTGPDVIGIVATGRPTLPADWPYLGDLDILPELLTTERVSEVAVCLDAPLGTRIEWLARICSERRVRLSIPAAHIHTNEEQGSAWKLQQLAKRALDISGGITGLILAAPILLAAAAATLASDGSPVFFRQLRAGRDGQPFRIVKYRTMHRDADDIRHQLRGDNEISAGAFKMKDDPRVTRLGRWLRRTSIDELPQLWNVLKGEMSLVGPRPHPFDDIAGYDLWHLQRLSVKPGMTGLWQVELRGDTDFNKWVAKDIEYIERWSVWLDIKLIVRTIPAVLRGTGR